MPLHALACAKPPAPLLAQDFAFDPRLPAASRSLLERLLADLYRLNLMPRMASCCCFCAELVAALLCRNGLPANAIPCRLIIQTPEGTALLGPGFAAPGQIDCHFAVLAGPLLIDWALGAGRHLPGISQLPLGLAVLRDEACSPPVLVASDGRHRLVWEPVEPSPSVCRQHRAEKLKAARVLKQASLQRGRP